MSDTNVPLPDERKESKPSALTPSSRVPASANGQWPVAGIAPLSAGPNLTVYFHALRRRWLAVVGMGLLCAAIAAPAVWFGVGAQYQAIAYFRVSMAETPVAFETDLGWTDRERFEIYKNTQQQYILSPFVLMAALRKPEVAQIPAIREERQKNRDPIIWLAKRLSVAFPGRAEVMTVSITRRDPQEALTLVRAVVEAYMTEVVNAERNRKRERLSELERVCTAKEEDIRSKRQQLKNLGQDYGTAETEMLTLKQRLVLEELTLYRGELARTQFELKRLQGELAAQKALLENVDRTEVPAVELDLLVQADPIARQLANELGWKKMDEVYTQSAVLPGVKSHYADRYRSEVQMLQEQFDARLETLRQKAKEKQRSTIESEIVRLETLVATMQAQYDAVAQEINTMRAQAEKFGITTVEIEMLRNDLKNAELVAAELTNEREKLRVELGSIPRIALLELPDSPPQMPTNTIPRILLTIFAALGSAVLPGVGIVLWDVGAQRINTTEEVSKGLRLPVIGAVPRIPPRVIRQLGTPSKRYQSWHLRLTESVDGIVARLLRKADLQPCRVIMVSSATGGEGKTTLATQLALSLARSGRRVVLVDFDLRRPAFDEVFNLPAAPGVCEFLRGKAAVDELVHPVATENLSVVTAGRWDRQALAALSNGNAATLFQRLRQDFDFVVVDTSPILPVADARFVSQLADTVVLSIFRDVSEAPKIQAACEILAAFGVPSVEAVVTGSNEHLYGGHTGYESTINAE